MKSEEYIEQVNRLMDLQNLYLTIFLTILGMVIAIAAFLQWRMSEKQMKQIKETTKAELIEKYKLGSINDRIDENEKEIEELKLSVLNNEKEFIQFVSRLASSEKFDFMSGIIILEKLFDSYQMKIDQTGNLREIIISNFLNSLMWKELKYARNEVNNMENENVEIEYISNDEIHAMNSFYLKIMNEIDDSETLNKIQETILKLEKFKKKG